jgi:hypothetical protein
MTQQTTEDLATVQVWDETTEAWTTISLPRHPFVQDYRYEGIRRWCETCADLYDEKWGPDYPIHQVAK